MSVDVSVTDVEGVRYENLTKQDFKLFSDGQEQPLSFFQVERRTGPARPLAIVFAVDISGSMTTEEMLRLRTALRAFSGNVADQQAVYAVMAFGMNVKLLQKFTTDASRLDRALERMRANQTACPRTLMMRLMMRSGYWCGRHHVRAIDAY